MDEVVNRFFKIVFGVWVKVGYNYSYCLLSKTQTPISAINDFWAILVSQKNDRDIVILIINFTAKSTLMRQTSNFTMHPSKFLDISGLRLNCP